MKLVDRKTGAIVDIPDDKAQAAYMSGKFGIPKGGAMPVKSVGLEAGVVDPADAAAALSDGARVAKESEFRRAQDAKRYGGVGGAAAAAGIGAARGAAGAVGLPLDAALTTLADMGDAQTVFSGRHELDPYRGERDLTAGQALRETLSGYQRENAGASAAGELAGMAGAAALTGGGMLSGVGSVAEGVAGKGLAGAVARAAAEGGALGAVGTINESALGDEKVTAGKLLAGIGHGALVGGALGGGLHLGAEAAAGVRDRVGRFLGTMRPEDVETLATNHFGYAPKGLGERIKAAVGGAVGEDGAGLAERAQKGFAKLSAGTSGKDAEAIERFTALTPEGAEARRIGVFDAPEIQAQAERDIRKHVDNILNAGDLVSAEARGELKADYVRKAVRKDNGDAVESYMKRKLDDIEEGLAGQLSDEVAPSMVKSIRTVQKLVTRARRAMGMAGEFDPELGVSLVRGEQEIPLGALRDEVWEPKKLDSLRKDVAAGKELEPIRVTRGEDGKWVIEDGIHRTALARERGDKTIRAITTEYLPKGDNADAFIALDNLKRGMQRLTSTGYRSLRMIADPVDQLNARRTVTWLDGAAADLRGGLENEDLWGKAATDQRTINAAWTKQIDASKRFHRSLTTEVGRDPNNPYVDIRGADPAKVASYVKGLTNPYNDLTHTAVKDFVAGSRELSEAIKASYDLPPDKLAEVARVAEASKGFGDTIEKAEGALVTANQFRQLLEGPEADSMGGMLGTVGGIVGGLPGGILGTLVGGAAGALNRPGKVIAQMAAIEKIASRVDNNIASGVKSFLSGGDTLRAAERKVADSVEFLSGGKNEREVFERKVQEVSRMAGAPEEVTANISRFTEQFSDTAPNVATALTVAALKGVEYLARTAPPGFQKRPEALAWGIDEKPLYTDAEMREWARRAAVVNDPMSAVRSMKRGMLTPEEADALRNTHPEVFGMLQREFQKQRIEKPSAMSYGQQLQVELMFGVPLSRTLDPAFMKAVQASFSVQEKAPLRAPSPKVSTEFTRSHASAADALRGGY